MLFTQKSVAGSTASTSASVSPHSSLPSTPQSPSSPHFEPATNTMWIAHLRWLMPQVHAPQYLSAAHITHDVQPLQVSRCYAGPHIAGLAPVSHLTVLGLSFVRFPSTNDFRIGLEKSVFSHHRQTQVYLDQAQETHKRIEVRGHCFFV